jgi:hypothetical protein
MKIVSSIWPPLQNALQRAFVVPRRTEGGEFRTGFGRVSMFRIAIQGIKRHGQRILSKKGADVS